jgi:inorganic pyrophosphatase/exopolyphosphatase
LAGDVSTKKPGAFFAFSVSSAVTFILFILELEQFHVSFNLPRLCMGYVTAD